MPLYHETSFRVRHYECDSFGRVSHPNYLRYMQEAAYEASASAGFDMVGYAVRGRLWLIRETEIDIRKPLHYGDTVIVRTWVKDFHRVRSIRAYELRDAHSLQIIAQSWSDWIFMDPETLTPCSIPRDMIQAFLPEPGERVSLPRRRFSPMPASPPGAVRVLRTVEWRDLDALAHANNAVYMAYLDEAAVLANSFCGWSIEKQKERQIQIAAIHAHFDYRLPAVLGDQLEIETWVSNVSIDALNRHFIVRRVGDDSVLCQAALVYGFLDNHTEQRLQLSPEFLADIASQVSEETHA